MDVISSFVYIKPGQSVSPLCIHVLKQSLSSAPLANLEATLTLHTNLSFFHLPIYLYSGLLTVSDDNDEFHRIILFRSYSLILFLTVAMAVLNVMTRIRSNTSLLVYR